MNRIRSFFSSESQASPSTRDGRQGEEESLLGLGTNSHGYASFNPEEMTDGPNNQSSWNDLPVYDSIHRYAGSIFFEDCCNECLLRAMRSFKPLHYSTLD